MRCKESMTCGFHHVIDAGRCSHWFKREVCLVAIKRIAKSADT